MPVERAVDIVASGTEPVRELVGSPNSRVLLAELRRVRDARSAEEAA